MARPMDKREAGTSYSDGASQARLHQLLARLRYKHLRLVMKLAESGNLHQTAEHMAMSQPAATRMLADIERAFGCRLFERHARGVHITPLGEEVLLFARGALARLDRCAEMIERSRLGGQGTLAVGAIMGAAPDLVAQAIIDLKQQQPLLQVRLMGETSDQLMEWLDQSRIELAIARFASPLQHNRFEFEALGNETLLAVVRRDHPLADIPDDGEEHALANLLDQWPWIMQSISSPARQSLEHEFERLGLCSPRDTIECGSIFAALQLVQRSDAILAMSKSVVRDHLTAGLIRALPIRIGAALTPYGLLTRRGEPLSAAALRFCELLRQRNRNG